MLEYWWWTVSIFYYLVIGFNLLKYFDELQFLIQ